MLKTVIMTWEWIELPINLGIEKEKISNRITSKDNLSNWFWAMFDSLCITADAENAEVVLISDYTEDMQTTSGSVVDYIELYPCWEIQLPRNRAVQAFNKPMVMGQPWDVLKIVAR